MGFLSFLRSRRIDPLWTYAPGGVIWRLLPAQSGIIVGEVRDPEQRRASFFALDERSGGALWEGRAMEEPWWVGIETVSEDVVLLHGFAKPDMPEHLGLHALDLRSGNTLWSEASVRYWFAEGATVYAAYADVSGARAVAIDLRSGSRTAEIGDPESALAGARERARSAEETPLVSLPRPVEGDLSPEAALVRTMLGSESIAGDAEFLSAGSRIAVGTYHSLPADQAGQQYRHRLRILRDDGDVVYDVSLDDAARLPLPDAFFARNGLLFCVQRERTLLALPFG